MTAETNPTEQTVSDKACPFNNLSQEFDPWQAEFVNNPYPFYARARKEESVFYSPQADLWFVSRYEDIWTVLRNPARFSAANALSRVRARSRGMCRCFSASSQPGKPLYNAYRSNMVVNRTSAPPSCRSSLPRSFRMGW